MERNYKIFLKTSKGNELFSLEDALEREKTNDTLTSLIIIFDENLSYEIEIRLTSNYIYTIRNLQTKETCLHVFGGETLSVEKEANLIIDILIENNLFSFNQISLEIKEKVRDDIASIVVFPNVYNLGVNQTVLETDTEYIIFDKEYCQNLKTILKHYVLKLILK